MAVNNNFYAISNEIFQRAAAGTVSVTQVVDYDTFIDAGKTIADLGIANMQNVMVPYILNKVQKTLNDNPSYRGQLVDMYAGRLDYGILEIIMGDFYAASASTFDGDTLTAGQTYTDQFKVTNLPNDSAKYVMDSDSYSIEITIRDTDLKGITDTPEKFDAFIRGVFTRVANSSEARKEEHRLAVIADIIAKCNAETAEDDDENAAAVHYDLLKIYNTLKSTSLTAANALLSNDFVSWSVGVIRDVALLMEKPSKLFSVNGNITVFSPKEYKKLLINGVYDKAIRRSLIDAYNKEYGMIQESYEVVPYWQNIKDRLRVTTNKTPAEGQSIVTTYSDYVLAVLYDKRSCGEMVQLDEVATDRNGGRRYTNYHYQFNNLYFVNLDANTVIFTLGPEPVSAG